MDRLDENAEEEDGDGEADKDCGDGVEELAEPPEVECSGDIFRRDVIQVAACSIVDSRCGACTVCCEENLGDNISDS